MSQRNSGKTRADAERRAVSAEVQRGARTISIALVAIALVVAGSSLMNSGARAYHVAALVVCCLVVLVLIGTSRLVAQIVGHTRALENETTHRARVVALLDAALSGSPVGFGFLDNDLRFLRVNDTLARMTGRATEDHIGLGFADLDPRLGAALEPRLREVLATGQPVANVDYEGTMPGLPGESRQWLTSCYPIAAGTDQPFGVGVAITEVTELKRLEQQLLQAQKMEAVGRLAGGVAHDFNNLLTVINSFAELILYDPEMEKGRDEVQEIRNATARAAKLTRQLLAFSRRQAMEPRIVNPNDVLRGVETLLRRLVVGNVDIVTNLSVDTPLIRVDPGQLEQVVMNLAINAADAMPDGGRLRIETASSVLGEDFNRRRDPDFVAGDYAMIRVSDTGHGMRPDVMEKIFEPFFTTKESGRGTGLGLSTVYGIVKQFGGQVDVASDPGSGSVFTVYLPTIANETPRKPLANGAAG